MVDFAPLTIFQAAFGHHQMDVWLEAQITPEGVGGVDQADANAGIEINHQFMDGLRRRLQEHLQKRAVGVEDRPQEVVGSEGDVEVRDIQQVVGDVVDPIVHTDRSAELATKPCHRRGRSGFCRTPWAGDEKLVLTARANIASVATVRVATEQQALDDLAKVSALVGRNCFFQAQIAPVMPMIEEDLTEAVVAGGITCSMRRRMWVGATPRGRTGKDEA